MPATQGKQVAEKQSAGPERGSSAGAAWDVSELMERLDGDRVFLCQLLQVFREDSQVKPQKSKSACYGGEEFLAVLNRCEPSSAPARAEHLRAAICERPVQAPGNSLSVSISVGLALSVDYQNCSADEIIHEADAALYAAKKAGRNCVRIAVPEGKAMREDSSEKKVTQQRS
jgi:predicted signal transduction protein with EAL and GGDEF domain